MNLFRRSLLALFAFNIVLVLTFNTKLNAQVLDNWQTLSLNGKVFSSVETTPFGIMVSENDSKIVDSPYNGVYLSKNLGESWQTFGLESRGVTDLAYDGSNNVYAATFYFNNKENGLFKLNTDTLVWEHLGNNISTTTVSANRNIVLLGTYSHGLWVSADSGQTWEQKIGTGYFGPKILKTYVDTDICLASVVADTYVSYDNCNTWTKLNDLSQYNATFFARTRNSLFVGTSSSAGLFRSNDNGYSWNWVDAFGNYAVSSLGSYDNELVVGKIDTQNNIHELVTSIDNGYTWNSVGLNLVQSKSMDLSFATSYPDLIFVIDNNGNLYRSDLSNKIEVDPFLSIPWNAENDFELYDKITAYFDHEYPLSGYSLYSEPSQRSDTSTNFMGIRDKVPYQYYSGHNGTDFGIDYGQNVYAAASGEASYYTCSDCGNSIKIDHTNGYQTIYMHLQSNDLVATPQSGTVAVLQGQKIGKIGMTGNTTGPHLHFGVEETQSGKQYPDNLVDPFSWLNKFFIDPWQDFSWTDILGQHFGSTSKFLWNVGIPFNVQIGNLSTQSAVQIGNKNLILEENSTNKGFTLYISHYVTPKTLPSESGKKFKYVTNSSFVANLISNTGTEIPFINKPAVIEIDLSAKDLNGINLDSVKIYHWNDENELWEPLESILDLATLKILGQTYEFSPFAVFGETTAENLPVTSLQISGEMELNWYTQYPTVTLATNNPAQYKTFYSFGNDIWQEYTSPLQIQQEGIINFQYRSMDMLNQSIIEPTKNINIKIDTQHKWKKSLKISNSEFSIE